jgi:hypothetical protein
MKTADLQGAALDYYVAKAEGVKWAAIHERAGRPNWCALGGDPRRVYAPSTDWLIGGPLIEKYRFAVTPGGYWRVGHFASLGGEGDTPLQAICRAVVRAAFGDEVEEVGDA